MNQKKKGYVFSWTGTNEGMTQSSVTTQYDASSYLRGHKKTKLL